MSLNISLLGHPQLCDRAGNLIEISSKKGIALLALLATGRDAGRSRAWLQQKLWSSRDPQQAKASLRRELSNLRKALGSHQDCIIANNRSIKLDFDRAHVDLLVPESSERTRKEFLEGLDIPGEEDFEDWLRAMRTQMDDDAGAAEAPRTLQERRAGAAPEDWTDYPGPVVAIAPVELVASDDDRSSMRHRLQRLIVDSISRLRWLQITVPRSAEKPGDHSPGGNDTGRERHYLIETTATVNGDSTRIDFVLLTLPRRQVIWSHGVDLSSPPETEQSATSIQCCITMLAHCVERAEQSFALRSGVESSDCVSLLWQLRYHLNKWSLEGVEAMDGLLRKANACCRPNTELLLIKASHYALAGRLDPHRGDGISLARTLCREAIDRDPTDVRGPTLLGLLAIWDNNLKLARCYLRNAVALCPGHAMAHALLGSALYLDARLHDAVEPLSTACLLSAMHPQQFFILGENAVLQFLLGNYDEARKLSQQILLSRPDYPLGQIVGHAAELANGSLDHADQKRAVMDIRTDIFDPDSLKYRLIDSALETLRASRSGSMAALAD